MKFIIEKKLRPDTKEVISFRGEVSVFDLMRLRLSKLDRELISSINSDESVSAADYLLCLEMIFRQHAEQSKEQ